jgi:hypothetical protein
MIFRAPPKLGGLCFTKVPGMGADTSGIAYRSRGCRLLRRHHISPTSRMRDTKRTGSIMASSFCFDGPLEESESEDEDDVGAEVGGDAVGDDGVVPVVIRTGRD